MTVAELIAKLQTAPNQDAEVYVELDEYTSREVDVYAGLIGEWSFGDGRRIDKPSVLITVYGGHDDLVKL